MSNILHLIDTTGPGGAETVFLDMALASKKKGYKSFALIRGKGWVEDQLQEREIAYEIIDSKGSFNLVYLWALVRFIKKHKIDLIHAHLFGSGLYASMAGLLSNTPVLVTIHGMVDISSSERLLGLKTFIMRMGASLVVGVTEQIADMLKSLPKMKKQSVCTVYNGIDVRVFERAELRAEALKNHDTIKIGCLGNIRAPKNYPLAIQVIKELEKYDVAAELYIAGQGNDSQLAPLKDLVSELDLTSNVHFLGFTKNPSDFLSSLDVFLMSSSSEGHPLALSQAMANGLPVVSTPSGVEEVVTAGDNALISRDHSAESLAEHVYLLVEDNELRLALCTSSINKARSVFSVDVMIRSYLTYYEKIIERRL